MNDGQTPENNAALKRQQKNKEELAAKFKELGIPLINSENTGAEEEEDISSDFDWFDILYDELLIINKMSSFV